MSESKYVIYAVVMYVLQMLVCPCVCGIEVKNSNTILVKFSFVEYAVSFAVSLD